MNTKEIKQSEASRNVLAESQKEQFPYSFEAFGFEVEVHKDVFSPKHFHGWKHFTRALPNMQGKRFLEVGCGTGVTALFVARAGAEAVVALDINPAAVRNTQANIERHGLENITVRESDIFSALEKDERFDSIYWNTPFIFERKGYTYRSMLERGLFDPGYLLTRRFLREARKFLKPGGQVLVGTADFGDEKKLLQLARSYGYRPHCLMRAPSTEINPVVFTLYEFTR